MTGQRTGHGTGQRTHGTGRPGTLTRKELLAGAAGGIGALALGAATATGTAAAAQPSQPAKAAQTAQTDTRLRVLQWNIRNGLFAGADPNVTPGVENLEQMIEFIRREEPDVLFCVETYGSGDAILAGLNAGVPAEARYTAVQVTIGSPPQQTDPHKDNLWLFTRYPVAEAYAPINDSVLSSFNFGGARLELPGGKPLHVFSCWLDDRTWAWGATDDTAIDRRYDEPPRHSSSDLAATDETYRTAMAATIFGDRLPRWVPNPDDPVVIAGDFNTLSHLDWAARFANAPGHEGLEIPWPVTKAFEDNGCVDAYRSVYPDAGRYPGRTWSTFFGLGLAPGRIDYVFTRGKGIRAVDAHTHTRRLPQHRQAWFDQQFPFYSDHGSLTADLIVEGGGGSPFRPPAREVEKPFDVPRTPPGTPVPAGEITATATSANPGYEAAKALDGNVATRWESVSTNPKPPLPQAITLDLGRVRRLSGMTYLSRKLVRRYNGCVSRWRVLAGSDPERLREVRVGGWAIDDWERPIDLRGVSARYLRFEVVWGFGGVAAASELRVYELD